MVARYRELVPDRDVVTVEAPAAVLAAYLAFVGRR